LEITHNWGTEEGTNDEIYHNGRSATDLGVGFVGTTFVTNYHWMRRRQWLIRMDIK